MLTERIGIIHEPVELLGPQLFSLILQILVILREVEGIIFIQIQWSRQETIALRIRLLEFIVFLEGHKALPVVIVAQIRGHHFRAQTFRYEIKVDIKRNDTVQVTPTCLQITVSNHLIHGIPSLPRTIVLIDRIVRDGVSGRSV